MDPGIIFENEFRASKSMNEEELAKMMEKYHEEMKLVRLYQAQRSYIESFMPLINCDPDQDFKLRMW